MFHHIRHFISAGALAGVAALAFTGAAAAQEYPTKPVRMVIHIGPGSSMDIVGRLLAQKLNEAWNQAVIVDNRGGAGGTIGMDVAAKAAKVSGD